MCHTLAKAKAEAEAKAKTYASGATVGGHEIRVTSVALLDFPLLRSQREWEGETVPAALSQVQD